MFINIQVDNENVVHKQKGTIFSCEKNDEL